MTTGTELQPSGEGTVEQPPVSGAPAIGVFFLRVLGAVAIPIVAFFLLWVTFDFLRDEDANRLVVVGVAIFVGVAGVFFLYWAMNRAIEMLPERFREGVRPYVFVGPALVILSVFMVYPVINTVLISFKDSIGEDFVGLDNFKFVFTDEYMLRAIRNTAGWIILVPLAAVSIGLAFATLADRLGRGESIAKSLIFLPMAWLQEQPWNNLLLMVIMVWMQTGFAMVVLSAAIKSIPDEILEAARIDGASELQVFRRIIVPTILPTIVVVTTYMVINALKVFDIVFVIGSPEANGTVVIAERMIDWFFISNHDGRAAAIAVVLFVAIVPVMIWNIRRFREEEAIR